MGNFIDLTGEKFNRLLVLERTENKKNQTMWLCKCDCGNILKVSSANLKNNHTKSCGCYAKEERSKRMKRKNPGYKHGLHNTRLHNIWDAMKKRCYLKTHIHYKNYGGRGITVCDEWKNNFMSFYNWAINNGYEKELTIDRIDANGNYEPDNCRWATRKEQQNNKRNNHLIEYNGEIHSMSEWATKYEINYKTFIKRIYAGWSIEDALGITNKLNKR